MKTTMLILGMLLLTFTGFAQGKGEIRGSVMDAKDGVSVPGANVVVKIGNTLTGTQTDGKGNFVLKPLNPGVYSITISYTGFRTVTIEGIVVDPGKITSTEPVAIVYGLDIGGDVPEIFGWIEPIIRVDPLEKINVDQMEKMPGRDNFKNIIAAMTSQALVSDDGEIYFKGSRSDNMAYIVDGVRQRDGRIGIPSGAIGSIIVYTGGVPANYGDFTGGCVVIETQSYFDWLNRQKRKDLKKDNS